MKITDEIRKEFPFFEHNPDVCYLDNSATSLVPSCVVERMNQYDLLEKASPYRGMYLGSVQATEDYEYARYHVTKHIHATSSREIIFTRNATESINLVAYSIEPMICPGDEIVIGYAEHHSNMIPWQQLAKRTGAIIRYAQLYGEDALKNLEEVIKPRTRIVAVTQMSNVLGSLNPLKEISLLAHSNHALVVADGCQSVPHVPVDVKELDVDFLAFSGHKMLCPMGIGVLYGRVELLMQMRPFLYGGEMIKDVSLDGATWAQLPQKFEAGTVNVGGAIALGKAIEFYALNGQYAIVKREEDLTKRMMDGMLSMKHVNIIGSQKPEDHYGIVSFTVDDVHPHDVAAVMSASGIAIRAGHHCAKPLHDNLGITASSRASVMFYNTEAEIDKFLDVLSGIRGAMGYAD